MGPCILQLGYWAMAGGTGASLGDPRQFWPPSTVDTAGTYALGCVMLCGGCCWCGVGGGGGAPQWLP